MSGVIEEVCAAAALGSDIEVVYLPAPRLGAPKMAEVTWWDHQGSRIVRRCSEGQALAALRLSHLVRQGRTA